MILYIPDPKEQLRINHGKSILPECIDLFTEAFAIHFETILLSKPVKSECLIEYSYILSKLVDFGVQQEDIGILARYLDWENNPNDSIHSLIKTLELISDQINKVLLDVLGDNTKLYKEDEIIPIITSISDFFKHITKHLEGNECDNLIVTINLSQKSKWIYRYG